MKIFLKKILESTSMYMVVIYSLSFLFFVSFIFGFLHIIYFSPLWQLASLLTILFSAIIFNFIFAKIFRVVSNMESTIITAMILFFVMSPATKFIDLFFLALVGVVAVVSKYLLAIRRKHIFNPVAFGAFVLGFTNFGGGVWWVGSSVMWPFVLLVGLIVVWKIRRFALFLSCVVTMFVVLTFVYKNSASNILVLWWQFLTLWPIIFLSTMMLTEPLTTPPTKRGQIVYGGIVGVLASVPFHFGSLYSTPEFALLLGNLFSYAISLKKRLFLTLKEKVELAKNTFEFIFEKNKFHFLAGQYLEWTLPHKDVDARGIRRYFTIASSPTEDNVRLGVKFSENSSSFKKKLITLQKGDKIIAGNLSGDFTLPKSENKKLVFIAGGIGITPFCSMLQFLIDKNDKRKIVLFYSNKTLEDVAYREFLDRAEKQLNLKVIQLITDDKNLPIDWIGECGRLTEEILKKYVGDYSKTIFYISGPNAMVDAYKKLLHGVGIKRSCLMSDYFPGYV